MTQAKEKWDDVGNRFNDIARTLKERYDTNASFGEADKERVNQALHQLGDALDAGFTAIGDSLRDPGIRDDLKHAGVAVADALAATFTDLAEELKRAVRK